MKTTRLTPNFDDPETIARTAAEAVFQVTEKGGIVRTLPSIEINWISFEGKGNEVGPPTEMQTRIDRMMANSNWAEFDIKLRATRMYRDHKDDPILIYDEFEWWPVF